MDTNLYDFLRTIQAHVAHPSKGHEFDPRHQIRVTRAEFEWLTLFLKYPGTVVEFRSRETGRMITMDTGEVRLSEDFETPLPEMKVTHEPELEKHFAIAGRPDEVFAILHEAAMLSPLFAQIVLSVGRAYLETAPMCRACSQRHPGKPVQDCPDLANPSWEFKERKK